MKKLYILILFVFSGLAANSQTISATNVSISGDASFFLEGHATITNTGTSPKDVGVIRTVNNIFPGHNGYFCWVQCYGSGTSVAPDFITLAPGATTDVFRGDLETFGISGISASTYCFYDANNPGDSVCVDYLFDATTGLIAIPSGKNYISKPYPNPANESASFYVSTLKGSKNVRIKIYNMLGAEVKDAVVPENKNTVRMNTSELKSGIYFYSLWVNGKSSTSGKLMIARD